VPRFPYWAATGSFPIGGVIEHPNPFDQRSSVYRITEHKLIDARIFVVATFIGSDHSS